MTPGTLIMTAAFTGRRQAGRTGLIISLKLPPVPGKIRP
ncbi:hypothetical protein ASZ90_015927 [hydrocarbon metagenome]|uniref:Uncharacterized protein n=1 Tax=hydrocarbon metagenome TaxID=938273 RepID=A0A0W8F0P0_9ZZZZ